MVAKKCLYHSSKKITEKALELPPITSKYKPPGSETVENQSAFDPAGWTRLPRALPGDWLHYREERGQTGEFKAVLTP